MSLVCEFKNPLNGQGSILTDGHIQGIDRALQCMFVSSPVGHLAIPELLVNLAVQLVVVHAVHARAQCREPLLRVG
jgi:hypothetical protein